MFRVLRVFRVFRCLWFRVFRVFRVFRFRCLGLMVQFQGVKGVQCGVLGVGCRV